MNLTLESIEQENLELVYKGKIRDGKPGTLTAESYEVVRDSDSGLCFLKPFPTIDYLSNEYRNLADGTAAINDYFETHDIIVGQYLPKLLPYFGRGMTIADCGSGGGSLLDAISGMVASTIAIEPFAGYHPSLQERGHHVFSSVDEAVDGMGAETVDVALSIQVIEHTEDPVSYLKSIRRMLKPGGILVVFTPNLKDILLSLDKERYGPFWFRKAHNWYLDAQSLRHIMERAGFADNELCYMHEFGIENTFGWLKTGNAPGNVSIPELSSFAGIWQSYLEQTGQAGNVGVVGKKTS